MAYTTGTLGTINTTVLTPAIFWGKSGVTTGYGTSGSTGGVTKANYAANYVPCLANLNATFQMSDGYDSTNEYAYGTTTRTWPAIVNGVLYYPGGRGMVKLYPGDVVACDPNTGWPVLINNASALHTGGGGTSSWKFVPNL